MTYVHSGTSPEEGPALFNLIYNRTKSNNNHLKVCYIIYSTRIHRNPNN